MQAQWGESDEMGAAAPAAAFGRSPGAVTGADRARPLRPVLLPMHLSPLRRPLHPPRRSTSTVLLRSLARQVHDLLLRFTACDGERAPASRQARNRCELMCTRQWRPDGQTGDTRTYGWPALASCSPCLFPSVLFFLLQVVTAVFFYLEREFRALLNRTIFSEFCRICYNLERNLPNRAGVVTTLNLGWPWRPPPPSPSRQVVNKANSVAGFSWFCKKK
jgi:hypothetical protein